ncbi:hypothetical protein F5Y14DRAFT_417551 [Nemania sp. NC0429]|nr:hypothetical protein F5Y14DRAFT_417551 [Nemania sp. NC0429]
MMGYQWELDEEEIGEEREKFKSKEVVEVSMKSRRFNWLSRENRGASYISYNQFNNLPANAFEFGADGFAGACNFGGELLHLSAPSREHGIVFARGAFSSSVYARMSRAQMEFGGSATFGLQLAGEESTFRLGNMVERGCFNYRWPVNEYSLVRNDPSGDEDGSEVGTCTRFSYIKDGVCYQVMRLEQRPVPDITHGGAYHLFPPDSKVTLDIGGSIYLQLFKNMSTDNIEDSYLTRSLRDMSTATCLRVIDQSQNIRLEARVYQLNPNDGSFKPLEISKSSQHDPLLRSPSLRAHIPFPLHVSSAPSSSVTQTASSHLSTDQGSIDVATAELDYRTTVTLHKATTESGGLGNRSETFVAAIRLVGEEDAIITDQDPRVPSSEDMHRDMWIEPGRPDRVLDTESQATGVMWDTILQWHDQHTDMMTDFTEVSLMARCLEKILQVDLVPGSDRTGDQASALISNLFMHPTVNLQSLFWKVRFLVKVYGFLDRLGEIPEPPIAKGERRGNKQVGETDSIRDVPGFLRFDEVGRIVMLKLAHRQCDRIRRAIEQIMSFLVKLLLPSQELQEEHPSSARKLNPLMTQSRTDESEFYYIAMTIWYVVRSIPKASWESILHLRNFTQEQMKHSCIPADNCNFQATDKRKIHLLKWYHYGSLLLLAVKGILPASWKFAIMKKKVYGLSKAATIACTGMTASKSHYAVDDEIIDRLSFLARELGMEEFDAVAETVTSASIQRVRGREYTKRLNPGVPLQSGRGYDSQETSGPWEIDALCHDIRLNLLTLESNSESIKATKYWQRSQTREEEVALYKDKVNQFLNSEATLIPSWERSPMRLHSGWLHSEATAVHGSTLLDIRRHVPVVPRNSPRNSPQIGHREVESTEHNRLHDMSAGIVQGPLANGSLSTQFREIFNGLKETSASAIDWVSFRPPRQYYPDNFVNSLQGTPHLFRSPAINTIFVPATLTRFARQQPNGEYNHNTLMRALDEVKGSISMLDILASQQHSGPRRGGGYTGTKKRTPDICYYLGQALTMWASIQTPIAKVVSGKRALINVQSKMIPGQDPLFRALYDSLVDQSVQHRVLNITKLTESIVQILVFVIHPEAATGLSNHVLHVPRFSLLTGPTWTTSITLGSWRLTDHRLVALEQWSVLMANEFIELPKELKSGLKDEHSAFSFLKTLSSGVSFAISSVMLSTNAFGDFSRCTIISERVGNDSKSDQDELGELVEISNETWQVFVHQPQTARCLVFLHALGMLCNRLCENYRRTIAEFASSVEATDAFLLKEGDWTHDNSSLVHFQGILWSLDCFYKFQNSLKASFSSILDAKRELLGQIQEQAPQRSESLQGMCQEYIAKFESSVVELSQVNEYLGSNIALAIRSKDALSEILAFRDSRISLKQNQLSLKQNNAIQALTYLTIGYLPLGFITAVFAIPKEQDVLFLPMGRGGFIGAILIMSVVTYTIAAWLSDIVDFVKFPEVRGRDETKERPNLWKVARFVRQQLDFNYRRLAPAWLKRWLGRW